MNADAAPSLALRANKTTRRRSGITLIEVLAAMAIFMISLAAISQLIDSGSDMAVEASRTNTGTRLAQSKLAEVEAGIINVRDGGTGTFEIETDWSWEVTTTPSDAPNVYVVDVIVKSTVGREVKVRLTQMVFDPQYQGNASEAQPPADPGASQ